MLGGIFFRAEHGSSFGHLRETLGVSCVEVWIVKQCFKRRNLAIDPRNLTR